VEEQPETPKILDELSRSNSAKPASRQQSTARKRFIVVLCSFTVLIGSIALLGFQQWTVQQRLTELQDQNQQLSSTFTIQNTEIEQLRTIQSQPVVTAPVDDSAMRELETQQNTEITVLRQQLATAQQQQDSVNAQANLEWKILEAEYLLVLASQKLKLQGDLPSAITLLENADAALLASGSNAAFATRQAIADDLVSLRKEVPIDHAGLYLRLDALIGQVQSIDLLESMRDSFQSRRDNEAQALSVNATNTTTNTTTTTNTNGMIDASLAFLSSVFVWRKWDETPAAMIAPGADTLIKQNLQLVLEQAQLALLLRDHTLYRRSLENGIAWLGRYTAADSAIGNNLLVSLNELLAIDIDPPLPALERTLSAINQLTASNR